MPPRPSPDTAPPVPLHHNLHKLERRPMAMPVESALPPPSDENSPVDPNAVAALPLAALQGDEAWREQSKQGRTTIPAGYTYLAQLMGHDMGSSVTLDMVPHVPKTPEDAAAHVRTARYNMIENPLTLETVYGPGPLFLNHLYDPDTRLFRIEPGDRIARVFEIGGTRIRALYDERNRDTIMLHELTVAWMQFHNRTARALMARGQSPLQAYALARVHAVETWHGIIRHDILPRFVLPDFMAEGLTLHPEWELDEVSLLHGLFRAFHCMPLKRYPISVNSSQMLPALMKRGFHPSEAEIENWSIHWPFFLADDSAGVTLGDRERPLTGICFSATSRLRINGHLLLALDQATAQETEALRVDGARMRAARARLPDDTADPARLSADLAAHPAAPQVTPDGFRNAYLAFVLMVEAQLHGPGGRFGPLGSALLRASMEASIRRVRTSQSARDALRDLGFTETRPATMLDLITNKE